MIPLLDLKLQYQSIRNEVQKAVNEVLESQTFILGPKVEQFETEIAQYCGSSFAIGVASGSDAILLSLMALNISTGDEVITTPYTFFSTAGSIARLGATPIFTDINPKTYNIDPELLKKKITPKTKAIIPVHLFGQCAPMDDILDIAKKHQLPVIEDAAQALGAKWKNKKAGAIGDMGCFSFFPSKNLGGVGDGGMVVTNNPTLAEKIQILRVHGSKPKYFHDTIGCGSRLDAIQAAVLSVKLKLLDQWAEKRRHNAAIYDKLFADIPVETPYCDKNSYHVFNQYIIRTAKRDALREFLKKKSIATEIYYPLPLHLQKCFHYLGYTQGDMPESEKAAQETLALPIYPELDTNQQNEIAQSTKKYLAS